MKTVRLLSCVLASLLATAAFASCGESKPVTEAGQTQEQKTPDGTEAVTASAEPDPFDAFDFGCAEFRMLVGNNEYDGIKSSYPMICHSEASDGDIVNDAIYRRNVAAEDKLNIKFVFTENTDNYEKIAAALKKVITAGDDAYELIIHDLYPLSSMSVEGYFLNTLNGKNFDFSKPYWYNDYMNDLTFGRDDIRFILAGDYFMDILRSAHALYFNKDMFSTLYESPAELYDHVRGGTWTLDVFMEYEHEVYMDLNGNGKADKEDRFGYGRVGCWGPVIPWVISSDITFLSFEDDGHPVFAFNNERSHTLLEKLVELFWCEDAYDYGDNVVNMEQFMAGYEMFCGLQRVSTLETFRDMKQDVGVLPYPKFDEAQERYITSSHDTANVGVVPITSDKLDMTSCVLEFLSRETYDYVMPTYYETALKVKYSRDDDSAQMLDIIRGNICCVFPVAFGNYCGNLPLYNGFSIPVTGRKTDFASNYKKYEAKAIGKLDELWDAISEIEG